MSWRLQNRNHHQFRKKKLLQLRVQLLLHQKLMSSQKSLRVRMTRLLKMEQHMIKMKRSLQKVLRIVHLPAVLLEAHLENFQILTMEGQQAQMPHPMIRNLKVMIMGVLGLFSGDKGFDEPAWGTFDTNDDVDSVWGFNAVSTTKDIDQESKKDHYFSGSGEFGLNPIRTGSSQGGSFSQKSRPFAFDDSVPSTPMSAFNSGYSPPRYKDNSEPSFDNFSRFDSFRSTQDTGYFPQPETLGRFDSMRSSRDFDQGHGFPTFDDIPDPFGSSAPFRSSLDSQTPRRDSDPFGSSGSFRMSLDSQTPRRESDFFGSSAAPFRTSFDSQTPRGDSDAFGSSPFRTSFDSQTPRRDSDPFGSSGPFRTSMETPRKDSDHWSAF
ncbi:unnamed protein product [Malus baccata var. baccata]